MTNGRNWTRMSRQPPTGTEGGQRAAQILDHVNGADLHANRERSCWRLVLHSSNRYLIEITKPFVALFSRGIALLITP